MKGKGLLWAVILTFVYLIIFPFPVAILFCIITGAVIPWITGNQPNKDKDVNN